MGADSYVTGKVAFDQFFRIRHATSGFWLHYAPVPGSEAAPLLASRVMHDQDVFGLQARDLSPSPDPVLLWCKTDLAGAASLQARVAHVAPRNVALRLLPEE